MLPIAEVLPLVLHAVLPGVDPRTVHHAVFPPSTVAPAIAPAESTLALVYVIQPATLIIASVFPKQLPKPLFLAGHKISLVDGLVGVVVGALTALHVVLPVSDVLAAVGLDKGALTVGSVVSEESFVVVSVGIVEFAPTANFIVLPLAFVPVPVGPLLNAEAVSQSIPQFPLIDDASIVELHTNWLSGPVFWRVHRSPHSIQFLSQVSKSLTLHRLLFFCEQS
jgi:hypothetical protein